MKNNENKSIYDMFNDIDVDFSEFEKEDFNDIEKIKIKKKFRKSIGKKNDSKGYRKYVSAASIALISIIAISLTPVGTNASKIISDLVFDIKSALRIGEEENRYVKIINKSITKEGITIRLNEAILNDDELIVSITTKSDKKMKRDMRVLRIKGSKLYINGELVDATEMSSSTDPTKSNVDEVMFFGIDSTKYNGVVNIKLELSNPIIYKEKKSGELIEQNVIEGPFIFEFDLDTTNINKKIKTVDINKTIKLEDEYSITLDKYVYTPLSQKIYATTNKKETYEKKEIYLSGVDDLGNEVEFNIYASYSEKGQFVANIDGRKINISAKYLILDMYEATYTKNKKGKGLDRHTSKIKSGIRIDLEK